VVVVQRYQVIQLKKQLTNGIEEFNMSWTNIADFKDLQGHVIVSIDGVNEGSDEVNIVTTTHRFKMVHDQDCCENVALHDYEHSWGVENYAGATVLEAEESSSDYEEASESGTWTFYKLKTTKGEIWMRWLGTSNGYYSERVSVYKYDL
jgi:hypothetical protein